MRLNAVHLLPARRSLALFLAFVVCLAVWQVWLTWRLIDQERGLAQQHSRERLAQIADLAVAQVAGAVGEWDLSVRELRMLPPPAALKANLPRNGTLVWLAAHQLVATYPVRSLLFIPDPPLGDPLPDAFGFSEGLEFKEHDYDRAIDALRPLTRQPATRGEALLRIARLERKLNHAEAALAEYDRMSRETTVNPDGLPYALLGLGARCELQSGTRATQAAWQLRAALVDGRWRLNRETFEYYWAEANRILRTTTEPPEGELEISSLVLRISDQWQRAARTSSSIGGREVRPDASLLIWYATPERLTALLAPAGWLAKTLKLPANAGDIRWKLVSSGSATSSGHIVRSLTEAQLPWRIEFSSLSADLTGAPRPAIWLAAPALMVLLVLTGAYALYSGVNRELRVAQLQSDFVAAVSHEFRSPLTSLRSIAELLANGRLTDEARQRQSYVFLEREAGRLQRLVEDLLDFGRMESGRKQYYIKRHDALGIARAAVADFREDALATGFHVEMSLDSGPASVDADEESLRRALRNLLENAAKYSPDCRTVWVEGRVDRRQVAISVRDRGMGIDPREHRDIFHKFVRGRAAKKAGIKGTGIGLSMVREIVEACGGEIRLESSPGEGSSFTIILPLTATEETRA